MCVREKRETGKERKEKCVRVCVCGCVYDMVTALTAALHQGEWRGNIPYRRREGSEEAVEFVEGSVCAPAYMGACVLACA